MKLVQVMDKELQILLKSLDNYSNFLTVRLMKAECDHAKDNLRDKISDVMNLQERLQEIEED